MKKKLSTILTVLLILMFTTSTVIAGPAIKISAGFSLASLVATGTLTGLSPQTTVTVVLTAKGLCTIGEETIPITSMGSQILWGQEGAGKKNSERSFSVEAPDQYPCSNSSESTSGFIFWTESTISVYGGAFCGEFCDGPSSVNTNNPLLTTQDYSCATSFDTHSVDCKPVKTTVQICHATGSKNNPYVLLTVNPNGLNGHGKHSGDIIPAPANGCPK